jgi:hypothetical protein
MLSKLSGECQEQGSEEHKGLKFGELKLKERRRGKDGKLGNCENYQSSASLLAHARVGGGWDLTTVGSTRLTREGETARKTGTTRASYHL